MRFPIAIRFSNWTVKDHDARYIRDPSDLAEVLTPLRDAGIDVFHASVRRFWEPVFDGDSRTLAQHTKTVGGLPTITVGNVGLDVNELAGDGPGSLAELERRAGDGEFDLVAVGRALLSEPQWVDKVRDRKFDEIRPWFAEAAKDIYP